MKELKRGEGNEGVGSGNVELLAAQAKGRRQHCFAVFFLLVLLLTQKNKKERALIGYWWDERGCGLAVSWWRTWQGVGF